MNAGCKILEITSYPPPRAGWGVRVQFLKQHLEAHGHRCVVLNTGPSRKIPSTEYETVMSAGDYLRKVWRYSRDGFVCHVHVNGKSPQGLALALAAEGINVVCGHRCFLTFHAGEEQVFFPRSRAPMLVPVFWMLFTIPKAIICNSAAVKSRIAEYGVPPGKISSIPAFSRQYLQFDPVSLGDPVERFLCRFPAVLFSYMHIQAGFHPDVLLDAFAVVARRRPDAGLLICGLMGHKDGPAWEDFQHRCEAHGLDDRVCTVDDFDHDQFLTALRRASMYVRTPPADGVASSVLEALALATPVVAAENGSRPAGVVTYPATDATALAEAVLRVLENRDAVVSAIPAPEIADTLVEEANLLTRQMDQ
jgi:glycosyltransferase involved in cell wall biosynthesis